MSSQPKTVQTTYRQNTILFFLCIVMAAPSLYPQQALMLVPSLQRASQNSPLLKTEGYARGIAEADITTARIIPNPVLNLQSMHVLNSSQFLPGATWMGTRNRQDFIQVMQTFDLAGQRSLRAELAEKKLRLASEGINEIRRVVLSETASVLLDTWYARTIQDNTDRALVNLDSVVRVNRIRLNAKAISQADLARTEVVYQQYVVQRKAVEAELRKFEQQLQYLTQSQSSVTVDMRETFTGLALPQEFDSLYEQALSRRSDYRQAQAILQSVETNVGLQDALGKTNPDFGLMLNQQNAVVYAGLQVNYPLPLSDRNQGERQKAAVLVEQAKSRIEQLQRQIRSDLTIGTTTLNRLREVLGEAEDISKKTEEILRTVKFAYIKGATTVLDYLEAERSWYDTQRAYYDALYTYRKAYLYVLDISGLLPTLAE